MASRLTFHKTVDGEAWQYKIREQAKEKWLQSGKYRFWEHLDLSLKKAIVKQVERKTAEKIILEYEWLGDMAITNIYYGIFFGNFCGGVICINSNGVMAGNGRMYGLTDDKISYFARGACAFWTPIGSASKLLSFALKLEKKRGALVAHAFADTEAGEYGTVYQASNWLCLGKQKLSDIEMSYNGKNIHSRVISLYGKKNGLTPKQMEDVLIKNGWVKQKVNPKYRYCYILADGEQYSAIYNKISHLITEYPKRG